MPAGLVLELLGAPRLRDGAGHERALPSRRALALLAVLAAEGEVARSRLATLFWGELDDASARRNLRRELARLRSEGLEATFSTVGDRLRLGAGLASDIDAFRGAAACGDGAAALAAWRGPLLDGFELAEAAAFRDWLGEQRGRLVQRWRELAAQQAARCEAAGDARAALDWHARLVDDDPLQELHHVNVMRLHHLLGERRPALAAWERCRQVLRDELGIAPSPATVALAEQIRSPERLSSLALRRADAALRRVEAPFVGRAAETGAAARAQQRRLPSCSKAKPASARRAWRRRSCARDRRSPSAARRSPARRRCMPSPRRCARCSKRPSGWPASTASAPTTGAKWRACCRRWRPSASRALVRVVPPARPTRLPAARGGGGAGDRVDVDGGSAALPRRPRRGPRPPRRARRLRLDRRRPMGRRVDPRPDRPSRQPPRARPGPSRRPARRGAPARERRAQRGARCDAPPRAQRPAAARAAGAVRRRRHAAARARALRQRPRRALRGAAAGVDARQSVLPARDPALPVRRWRAAHRCRRALGNRLRRRRHLCAPARSADGARRGDRARRAARRAEPACPRDRRARRRRLHARPAAPGERARRLAGGRRTRAVAAGRLRQRQRPGLPLQPRAGPRRASPASSPRSGGA